MKKLFALFALGMALHSYAASQFIPYFDDGGNGLLTSLSAFWKFEEATGNVSDSSGNGRTLVESGSVSAEPGIVGNDRFYTQSSGVADYFSVASDSGLTFGSGAFTITAWVNPTPRALAPNDLSIITKGDYPAGAGTLSWWLFIDHGVTDDTLYFIYSSDGSYSYPDSSHELAITFPGGMDTGWMFIAVRWDGATLHMSASYAVDGALSSDTTKAFAGPFYNNGGDPVIVGANLGSALHHMDGDIDEVGIWKAYLSDCQLQWLYTARAGTFTYSNFDASSCVGP